MGCTGSKLAGDDFNNIDATAVSSAQTPSTQPRSKMPDSDDCYTLEGDHTRHSRREFRDSRPLYYDADQELPFTNAAAAATPETKKSSTFGSHEYMASGPVTGKPKRSLLKSLRPEIPKNPDMGRAVDDVRPAAAPRRIFVDGKELVVPSYRSDGAAAPAEEREQLLAPGEGPVLRTDQDRKRRDPVTGKKPGLYQRYTNARLGVGEERDPVTGRGLYTGMTKEETITYVRRTRGSGMMGDKHKYSIGGYDNGMAIGFGSGFA